MALDSNNILLHAIDEADELMAYFKSRGLQPADSALIIGALNAAYLVQARKEGKMQANIDSYTDSHREAMQLFLDLHDRLAGRDN